MLRILTVFLLILNWFSFDLFFKSFSFLFLSDCLLSINLSLLLSSDFLTISNSFFKSIFLWFWSLISLFLLEISIGDFSIDWILLLTWFFIGDRLVRLLFVEGNTSSLYFKSFKSLFLSDKILLFISLLYFISVLLAVPIGNRSHSSSFIWIELSNDSLIFFVSFICSISLSVLVSISMCFLLLISLLLYWTLIILFEFLELFWLWSLLFWKLFLCSFDIK